MGGAADCRSNPTVGTWRITDPAWLALAASAQAAPTLVKVADFAEPTFATGAPGDAARRVRDRAHGPDRA